METREIITVFIGQAGVQISSAVWELLCQEHGVMADGRLEENVVMEGGTLNQNHPFFYEGPNNRFMPRGILVDLEPTCIDEIRSGCYRDLFHPSSLISSQEDASSIFSRGYHSLGNREIHKLLDRFRILMEACDCCSGIMLTHSAGGGTGSGFSSLFLDEIVESYKKNTKLELVVFPSGMFSAIMVEPYNACLAAHYAMDNIDITMIFDNDALYRVCYNGLEISHPSFTSTNRLMAMIFSCMTASMRFGGILKGNLITYQTNLIPYPRIHFPVCSYAPMTSKAKATHEDNNMDAITRAVFSRKNQLCNIDVENGRYVSNCLLYRGKIAPADVYTTINKLKANESLRFVDWCPTGIKVSICETPPVMVKASGMAQTDKIVMMMSNSSAIQEPIDRVLTKMAHLFNKRAFMHWYVGEGIEEAEFTDAVNNILTLISDYDACFGLDNDYTTGKSDTTKSANISTQKSFRRSNRDQDSERKKEIAKKQLLTPHSPRQARSRKDSKSESKSSSSVSKSLPRYYKATTYDRIKINERDSKIKAHNASEYSQGIPMEDVEKVIAAPDAKRSPKSTSTDFPECTFADVPEVTPPDYKQNFNVNDSEKSNPSNVVSNSSNIYQYFNDTPFSRSTLKTDSSDVSVAV